MSQPGLKIIVSSQDGRTVSGHAGQTKQWLVFETDKSGTPSLAERIALTPAQVFHRFQGPGPHPLDGAVDAILAGMVSASAWMRSCASGNIRAC